MTRPRRHLAIVGLMGSGKTTVGRLVALHMGLPLLDSDDALEARFGHTGRQLVELEGVDALHEAEAEHLMDALAHPHPAVIAPAASIFDREECVEALRTQAWVVWLDVSPKILVARVEPDDHRRPVDIAEVRHLRARRHAALDSAADLAIQDESLEPAVMVERIVGAYPRLTENTDASSRPDAPG